MFYLKYFSSLRNTILENLNCLVALQLKTFDISLNNHLSVADTESLQYILCTASNYHLKEYIGLLPMRGDAT